MKDQFGSNEQGFVAIELTRQDIASFIGAAYGSIFRTINELTEERIIVMTDKNILIIINEEMLTKLTLDENLRSRRNNSDLDYPTGLLLNQNQQDHQDRHTCQSKKGNTSKGI